MFYTISMDGVSTPMFILTDLDEAITLFNNCMRDFSDSSFTLYHTTIAEMANYGAEEAAA
jgi:hypothetical protein